MQCLDCSPNNALRCYYLLAQVIPGASKFFLYKQLSITSSFFNGSKTLFFSDKNCVSKTEVVMAYLDVGDNNFYCSGGRGP